MLNLLSVMLGGELGTRLRVNGRTTLDLVLAQFVAVAQSSALQLAGSHSGRDSAVHSQHHRMWLKEGVPLCHL